MMSERLHVVAVAIGITRDAGTLDGIAHRVVTVDLADPDGAERLSARTADLDIGLLISNAGTGRPGDLLDADIDDLRTLPDLGRCDRVQ